MLKRLALFLLLLSAAPSVRADEPAAEASGVRVSLYGNTYVTAGPREGVHIDASGVGGWSDPATVLSTYFAVEHPGKLSLALCGRSDGSGPATLEVRVAGKRFKVRISDAEPAIVPVGSVRIEHPGYVRVDLKGLSCRRDFGHYTAFVLDGAAAAGRVTAVPGVDAPDNWPYWGRRGPSVHMNYIAPADEKIRYFYNEVTVPEGEDVLHSYFMVNGFSGGYMGMQVNGPKPEERRILFSVWSAFTTDDPRQIPEQYQIKMLRRGEGVHIGEFGHEGSGGQSYVHYPWKAGHTYRFLTEVVPDGPERTIYTGYFCGDDGVWRLVASFMRPEPGKKVESHYTGMHSFLENFNPSMGYATRKVHFGNQWAVTVDGRWIELTEARFSVDNTGRRGIRLDYGGGVEEGQFYLKNCGFFDGTTAPGSRFSRPAAGRRPEIDFEALERIPSVE